MQANNFFRFFVESLLNFSEFDIVNNTCCSSYAEAYEHISKKKKATLDEIPKDALSQRKVGKQLFHIK